jgi:hypothetical protein
MEKLSRYKKFIILAIAPLVFIYGYYWLFGEPLFFKDDGDPCGICEAARQSATFERKGRVYLLSRVNSPGSGNYTLYTLSAKDEKGQKIQEEFSTCGKFKLEADRILFFEPREFHCGFLLTPIDELTGNFTVRSMKF